MAGISDSPGPYTVLLVEDSLPDTILVKAHLAQSGIDFRVESAGTLSTARQLLRDHEIDVVLLDLTLPDSNGLDTFLRMHTVSPQTPMVILTGHEDADLAITAVRRGAQDYLPKSRLDRYRLSHSLMYAVERARRQRAERDMMAAGAVQQRLIPAAIPRIDGFELAGRCEPSTFAGSDFFDVFHFNPHKIAIVLAHTVGRGMGPTLLMTETRAIIRSLATMLDDVGPILTRTSQLLARNAAEIPGMSIFLASLDIPQRTIQYVSAGQPGFILDVTGKTRQLLKSNDPPLGFANHPRFLGSSPVPLAPGEGLFLFTDGLAACVDGRKTQFGKGRVFDALRMSYRLPAEQTLVDLIDSAQNFSRTGQAEDDMTAVLIKAQPVSSPAPAVSVAPSGQKEPV